MDAIYVLERGRSHAIVLRVDVINKRVFKTCVYFFGILYNQFRTFVLFNKERLKNSTMAVVTNNVKSKLEVILIECFEKAAEKKFKNLNFVFPANKTPKQFFKLKIQTLNKLDEYSQTFLSIHTRAKLALREFQQQKFDDQYLFLLKA